MRLARVALDAALALDGVAAGHRGSAGAVVTSGAGEGVAVAARPDGRYDVVLALTAYPVPLHALAGEVRAAVASAADRGRLGDALGEVAVSFEDVRER